MSLFNACEQPKENDNIPRTQIEFINQENFPVSIYTDPSWTNKIANVDGNSSAKVDASPNSAGTPFYIKHLVTFEDIIVIEHVSPAIISRIDENVVNKITIPKLSSISSSNAYVKIKNKSMDNLSFNTGTGELLPIGAKSTLIVHNEEKAYKLNPGISSYYSIRRNTNITIPYPDSLINFEAGKIYVFEYDGSELKLNTIQINLQTARLGLLESSEKSLSFKINIIDSIAENDIKYTILIFNDEEIDPSVLSYNKKITILLKSENIIKPPTIRLKRNGSMFTVGANVHLILDNGIILIGRNNTDSLIKINSGGTFTVNNGEISGNITSHNGGGIYVDAGGFFFLRGGKISNNISNQHGGGIYVNNDGQFSMINGEISANISRNGYGGGVYTAGIFMMGGGVIYGGNAASNFRNIAGSGSFALHSTGNSKYGTIYGTEIGDIFKSNGSITNSENTLRVVNGNLQIN
ncbi:MAG: hypothetical protein FWB86_09220 [Treponema sp.]|nr:hypothetical protein [Treponema sp.]